jgi:hypothetical protein
LERGQRFEFTSPLSQTLWFTVGTWYKTWSHTSPQCVSDDDPSQKIRASLAMLYLTALGMAFTLQVSFKSFKEEQRNLELGILGHHNSLPLSREEREEEIQGKRSLVNAAVEEDEEVVEVSL